MRDDRGERSRGPHRPSRRRVAFDQQRLETAKRGCSYPRAGASTASSPMRWPLSASRLQLAAIEHSSTYRSWRARSSWPGSIRRCCVRLSNAAARAERLDQPWPASSPAQAGFMTASARRSASPARPAGRPSRFESQPIRRAVRPLTRIATAASCRAHLALKVARPRRAPRRDDSTRSTAGSAAAVASAIGERMAPGQRQPVLVVTHSPQVAPPRPPHHYRMKRRTMMGALAPCAQADETERARNRRMLSAGDHRRSPRASSQAEEPRTVPGWRGFARSCPAADQAGPWLNSNG